MRRTIDIPPFLSRLSQAFYAAGHPLYLVGGYVRNSLLNLPVSDLDITSSMPPDDAAQLLDSLGISYDTRDMRLGTLGIHLEQTLEYTCFRTESYPAGGAHIPSTVAFTTDMAQDAARRDFTCNAIYAALDDGTVVDPLGGIEHLAQNRLVACKQPQQTIADDGLRILRMVRFACQLGMEIEPQLFAAAKENIANLADIATERKRQELSKALLADVAYPSLELYDAHAKALLLLHELGAFSHLIPELLQGMGLEQSARYHKYDVYWHNLNTCAATPPQLVLRLAGLLHDIAKPQAFAEDGTMHAHETLGAQAAVEILTRLTYDKKTIETVKLLIARHMFDLDGRAKQSTVQKRFARWGFGFAQQLIHIRRADVLGSGMPYNPPQVPEKWQWILDDMVQEGAIDDMAQLNITGEEIMKATGLKEGREIGRIKQLLFERVATAPQINQKGILMNEAKHLARGLNMKSTEL